MQIVTGYIADVCFIVTKTEVCKNVNSLRSWPYCYKKNIAVLIVYFDSIFDWRAAGSYSDEC